MRHQSHLCERLISNDCEESSLKKNPKLCPWRGGKSVDVIFVMWVFFRYDYTLRGGVKERGCWSGLLLMLLRSRWRAIHVDDRILSTSITALHQVHIHNDAVVRNNMRSDVRSEIWRWRRNGNGGQVERLLSWENRFLLEIVTFLIVHRGYELINSFPVLATCDLHHVVSWIVISWKFWEWKGEKLAENSNSPGQTYPLDAKNGTKPGTSPW